MTGRHWLDPQLALDEEPAIVWSGLLAAFAVLLLLLPFSRLVTVLIIACAALYVGRLIRNRVTPVR